MPYNTWEKKEHDAKNMLNEKKKTYKEKKRKMIKRNMLEKRETLEASMQKEVEHKMRNRRSLQTERNNDSSYLSLLP
jgi:hypothetical protein